VSDLVVVVPTGTANLASIMAGLERAGAAPRLMVRAKEVGRVAQVVLPGVGAFGAAMQRLEDDGVATILAERIRAGRPTLAVCVGLQLLCESSEESPGVSGLGVLPAQVTRYPDTVRVPQLGWNAIEPVTRCRMLAAGHAYFANSYRLTDAPPGWRAAYADHGGRYVAALERGPVLACQFHPELSGALGVTLITRWLKVARAAAGS
jgi:imidazole glycerol phosphate synthase glutamine amidotransferase subunit